MKKIEWGAEYFKPWTVEIEKRSNPSSSPAQDFANAAKARAKYYKK